MDKPEDVELVKRFQSGNMDALNDLVRRWHKQFCTKAFWLVKDGDLAKDIAQDSWSIIMDKIGALKDPQSFGNWALRIVYSKSLDVLRKASKDKEKKKRYLKEHLREEVEKDDNSELEKALLIKVRQLPEHQQSVIKLFYIEEYSLKEISKILNISIGTAKSRLYHARETIKKTLKNKNHEK